MINPSNFKNDPYGYITNQISHGGGVGMGMAIIVPFNWGVAAAVVTYWVLIEAGLQEKSRPGGSSFFDGLEDATHVGFGFFLHGAIQTGEYWPAACVFSLWMALLAFGAWMRS